MKTPRESTKPLTLALTLAFAALAATAFVAKSSAVVASRPTSREAHPLDALDRAVQKRFHSVIGFGMARIGTEKRFAPETAEEKQAVRDLKRAGYSVGLYLAGRAVLEDVPERDRYSKVVFGSTPAGQAFSGPIFMSTSGLKGLPKAAALWDETRRALHSFAEGSERYGFKSGEWDVEARPVRASEESCLKCHVARVNFTVVTGEDGTKTVKSEPAENAPKVGDPLGVLVYSYRKKR